MLRPVSRRCGVFGALRNLSTTPKRVERPDDVLSHDDYFDVSSLFTKRELMDAGVHLGHKAGAWNPLMKPYILGERLGIHVVDLDQTANHLRRALNVIGHVVHRRGVILFVHGRPEYAQLTQQTARDAGEYFATGDWKPGTLTNSHKLLSTARLPDLAIFFSTKTDQTALRETVMCNIPTIGIVDTDCNPNLITYTIPGNDDTPSSIRLFCSLFRDAILRGKEKDQ